MTRVLTLCPDWLPAWEKNEIAAARKEAERIAWRDSMRPADSSAPGPSASSATPPRVASAPLRPLPLSPPTTPTKPRRPADINRLSSALARTNIDDNVMVDDNALDNDGDDEEDVKMTPTRLRYYKALEQYVAEIEKQRSPRRRRHH